MDKKGFEGKKSEESQQKKELHVHENPQIVFSWTAALRPYVKRSRQVIRFYIAVTLLISLIVLFFGDKILLIPLWTLLFIFYVFTVTPPPDIVNKITHFGVETAGPATLRWEVLSHFYFTKRFGHEMLTLVTHPPSLYHMYLVVPSEEVKKKVTLLLSEHIVYLEKPRKTFTEKLIDWLSQFIPEEEQINHTPLSHEIVSSQK
ncbi:hypothetical protein HYT33_04095 [Candidatus Roizmanbacteria bacterium]|nr:hypothetical protein [Candidatus Roizmanbacteria bacterium]